MQYLLLQIRDADDPMRTQEVGCFARVLSCEPACLTVVDLLSSQPTRQQLDASDIVLIGGSGNYSVVTGGDWLSPALETMCWLHDRRKPTFASCWGFQAMAAALGGQVVTDLERAEVGTHTLRLTAAGRADRLFRHLPATFLGHMGHQDIVDVLPPGAVLLASTDRVANQAFCFADRPIYCTQFHPELQLREFMQRVVNYPEYVQRITGQTIETFSETCSETPAANRLLPAFVDWVRSGADG